MTEFLPTVRDWMLRGLRRGAALISGWGAALLFFFLTVETLAPGTVEEFTGLFVLSALVVIGFATLYVFASQWIRNIPEERCRLRAEDEALKALVRDFRMRGRLCRVAATGLFLSVTIVALFGFYTFTIQGWSRSEYHEGLPVQLRALVEPLLSNEEPMELLSDPNAVAFLQRLLDHGSQPWWNEGIGSLLFLFFLLRVTASLYKYMVRLASFYESRADYLQLGGPTEGLSPQEILSIVDASTTNDDTWMKDILESIRNASRRRDGVSGAGPERETSASGPSNAEGHATSR